MNAERADEDRLMANVILTKPIEAPTQLGAINHPAFALLADHDGALSRNYGALDAPRTIVLDPMLRAIANIAWQDTDEHIAMLRELLRGLPSVDDQAGVPMNAPVLIVPRVFDFPLCELLVKLYDRMGGEDSGFMLDVAGIPVVRQWFVVKRRDKVLLPPAQALLEFLRSEGAKFLPSAPKHF